MNASRIRPATAADADAIRAVVDAAYAIYLPDAQSSGTLDLSGDTGTFVQRWFNPRTGVFQGGGTTVSGGGSLDLGDPPHSPGNDWVVLLQRP